ncbi:MAG TPA: T9SS type A sorting domain-containing protein [Bacteroidia bacterium]
MKKIYLLLVLNSLMLCSLAQNFSWAKREGLYAYDYGFGIVNDNLGNVYVAGKYEEEAIFSGNTLVNHGNHDMFLVRYSPAGTVDWIRTAGGNLGDYAQGLAIDASNNLVVTGEIEGYGNTILFQGSAVTLTCVGDNDIFLAKYDMNGNLLWAKSEGYNYSEKGLAVTCDLTGNVYVCGYYTDTTKIAGSMYISAGGKDIFLAKYDPNGNFLWLQRAGSAGRDEALAVKCDAAGNVYMAGLHSDLALFGTQTLTTGPGAFVDYDIFLAKYNSSGVMQWVKSPGSDYDDVAWDLTLDSSGKIYLTGEYNAYAVFDGFSLTSTGMADIFVACYDPVAGNTLWAKSAGGPLIDRARGIGCDGSNLFITGQFGNIASFNSVTLSAADSSDVFIAALDPSGNFTWAKSIGGPADSLEALGYESGNSICAEATGSVYATGAILDGASFGTLPPFLEYGRTDAFVTKITLAGVGVPSEMNSAEISLYPNPNSGNFTLDLMQLNSSSNLVMVYNSMGQLIEQKTCDKSAEIDISKEGRGAYFIKVISDQSNYSSWFIVQ